MSRGRKEKEGDNIGVPASGLLTTVVRKVLGSLGANPDQHLRRWSSPVGSPGRSNDANVTINAQCDELRRYLMVRRWSVGAQRVRG